MNSKYITIKGAREHNLKNIDLKIPREKLVVITGLSGSGKSSLAFDTIYAEGQRRYVESLSAYARQFLEQMPKPDVDSIDGLSPAISIEQKSGSKNPRSTVGTVTEIYDYLRLLFARIGKPYCYECGKPISSQTVSQIVDKIRGKGDGSRVNILAPVVRGRKGEYQKDLVQFQKEGFVRVKIDGKIIKLGDTVTIDKNKKHNIDLFIDRLILKEGIEKRLADSIETAVRYGEGVVKAEFVDDKEKILEEKVFSQKFACIDCGISYPEIEPRMFSFNSPYGACPTCTGLGTKSFLDPALVIPNPSLSIREGAIHPWEKRNSEFFYQMLEALSKHYKFSIFEPFGKLPKKIQDLLLYGSGDEEIDFYYEMDGRKHFFRKPFEGVIPNLERRYKDTDSDYIREEIEAYMGMIPCHTCKGARLKKESLHIKVSEKSIYDISRFTIKDGLLFFARLELSKKDEEIARRILKEIRDRLSFLVNVGLDYITLDRTASTLAGGEAQRIRLATQIGSSLVGVLYILDEPSIGLHQRDNKKLLATLKHLRDIGNTVLVVEHDEETMMEADHLIDLGPGAGESGGHIVFEGAPNTILKSEKSLTGKYLAGKLSIPVPAKRRAPNGKYVVLKGAKANNLKEIDVKFPMGVFVCVTGVSGSGKSTLVIDTLHKVLKQKLYMSKEKAGDYKSIEGVGNVDKVIDIDQSPIGRTPRSNPATYTQAFGLIRDHFSMLPESKIRGYKPGRYSFNVRGGRCEACEGDGMILIEMHFLPDIFVQCEVCGGKRYNRETLEVKYKGKNISEVLEMTVDEGFEFFANIPRIKSKLQTLKDVGLGYIRLGQSATTLSGGEAQRIKLSKELSKRATGKTLYILDEPTTGLHFDDIKKLLTVLNKLVGKGNTVIVIEHNLDVIKCADHIIDLGPEGGDAGGEIIAEGTPEAIAKNPKSYTGQFIKQVLAK
jgi:excinuclease ABC subunit A